MLAHQNALLKRTLTATPFVAVILRPFSDHDACLTIICKILEYLIRETPYEYTKEEVAAINSNIDALSWFWQVAWQLSAYEEVRSLLLHPNSKPRFRRLKSRLMLRPVKSKLIQKPIGGKPPIITDEGIIIY